MSYSFQVKQSLLSLSCDPCCQNAELYGFLLFSNTFTPAQIRILSAYPQIPARYLPWLREKGAGDFAVSWQGTRARTQVLTLSDPARIERLLRALGNCSVQSPLHIDFGILEQECCQRAFLRGAFMAGGMISDPRKGRFVEFRTGHHVLAADFLRLCEEMSLFPGTSLRRGKKILYLKSSEAIQDFLASVGATEAVLDFANAEILKNIRNGVNRARNCDAANADKIVSAAGRQMEAIRFLTGRGYAFPEGLAQVARLRLEFPEENLEALGRRCQPPLSKSGVSHRMKKICDIAAAMEEKPL